MVSNAFVVAMGLGTVFVGLICIVFMINIMSKVVGFFEKRHPAPAPAPQSAEDDSELVAVITAALAQDLGTDASRIVIRSIKSAD